MQLLFPNLPVDAKLSFHIIRKLNKISVPVRVSPDHGLELVQFHLCLS
jgi:hypothetical protein